MKTVDKILIAIAVAGALACFGGRQKYTIRNTPEGASCARECMQMKQTCLIGAHNDGYQQLSCAKEEDRCRSTCPGAEAAQ